MNYAETASKSSERTALWIRAFKKPILLLVGALAIYKTLGLPAVYYGYTGSKERPNTTRFIDLLGNRYEFFYGNRPFVCFIREGEITFPKRD